MASLAAAGCVAGEGGGPSTNPDASKPGGDAKVADAGMADAPAPFKCRDKVTTGLDNGHHNPGQDCQQGCHNHNFSMSGTLYSSANGGAVLVGAALTFIDANGVTGDMRSNLNGNFWWSLPVAFPVKIIASSCPDIVPMVSMVTAGNGGCNKNGCHTAAGGAGRIHLP